jgi:flagellar hook protein FlgE
VRANNIANAQTLDFLATTPALVSELPIGGVAVFAQDSEGPVNLARESIGLITASTQHESPAALIRTDEELTDTLLNTFG